MKILLCHNYYRQRGGEDRSFDDEARLLESNGQEVLHYTRHNNETRGMSRWTLAGKIIRNRETHAALRRLVRRHRPDVIHCTNTFLLLSPAVYDVAWRERVPVVQALRNYRLLCPAALLMRDGRVCEECLHRRIPWPGVRHACYRNSRIATAAVATMLCVDRWRKSRESAVGMYYTPSQFARNKFIEGGFPAERIAVKPNFIASDPGVGSGRGGYAVFAGRLSEEKGIDTLLAAWSRLDEPIPLKIIGGGPLEERVRQAAAADGRIEALDTKPLDEVLEAIGEAACLVVPSLCYETFGRAIAEAFAKGTPVVASRLGAPAELVGEGETGLLFEPGNADDLALKVQQLMRDGDTLAAMRKAARREYEQKFTAESNHESLMAIYRQALATANSNGAGALRTLETHAFTQTTP